MPCVGGEPRWTRPLASIGDEPGGTVRSPFTFNHAGERPHPLSRDRRCAWTQCRCQRVETDTLPRQIRDKKVVLDQRNASVDDGPVRDFKCAGEINPTFHVRLDGELISCINETVSISSDPSRHLVIRLCIEKSDLLHFRALFSQREALCRRPPSRCRRCRSSRRAPWRHSARGTPGGSGRDGCSSRQGTGAPRERLPLSARTTRC